MNMNDISTQLLYSCVPIHTEGARTGIGCICSVKLSQKQARPFLIAPANIFKAKSYIIMHAAEHEMPSRNNVEVGIDKDKALKYQVEGYACVCIPLLGTIENLRVHSNITVYYRSINEAMFLDEAKLNELPALSRVVALSFSDMLIDDYNYLPIMHSGNICTPVCNNYKGEPCFLVEMASDCALDGSPVFIYDNGTFLEGDNLIMGDRVIMLGLIEKRMERNLFLVRRLGALISEIQKYYE